MELRLGVKQGNLWEGGKRLFLDSEIQIGTVWPQPLPGRRNQATTGKEEGILGSGPDTAGRGGW